MFECLYTISVCIVSVVLELIIRSFGIPVPVLAASLMCIALLIRFRFVFVASLIFGLSFDIVQGNYLPLTFPLILLVCGSLAAHSHGKTPVSVFPFMPLGFILPFYMSLSHFLAFFRDPAFFPAVLAVSCFFAIVFPLLLSFHSFLLRRLDIGFLATPTGEGVTE